MGFFDLNIPYTESNKRNSAGDKATRLKLAVKAMELGYTGVAYNRTITGVMSEADRCSISLFPLSSVLKVSPSISSSVNLHRRLLNVPTSTPFRQYTRLSVVVDIPAQGSALNSGNPVLKTYDIVAVRPLKQESFDQACKNYEVDIISIDFLENRFRLKQPLIKAAIEFLVDWTRGKNLIFSSAAPSVAELRGPYDVANLACLLGFSMERAKAAVSRTCRSLLENALRKKKFYKEAIRVELISPTEQTDIEGAGFDDWLKWDPISSGDGDLQLDDMAKSFAASSKELKTVKAIDFVSIIDGLPSYGLHINDIISETKSEPYGSSRDLPAATKANKLTAVYDVHIDSKMHDPPENDQTSVMETLEKGHQLNYGNCDISSANETLEALGSVEGGETCAMLIEEETKIPSNLNICFSCPEAEQLNPQPEVYEAISEEHASDQKGRAISTALPTAGISITFADNPSTLQCNEANGLSSDAPIYPPMIASNEIGLNESCGDRVLSVSDASLYEEFLEGEHMRDTGDVTVSPINSSLPLSVASMNEDVPEEQLTVIAGDVSVARSVEHSTVIAEDVSVCTLATSGSDDELQNNGANSVVHELLEDSSMEVHGELKDHSQMNHLYGHGSSSERVRRKQGSSHQSISFPFKRLLKPSHFKKEPKRALVCDPLSSDEYRHVRLALALLSLSSNSSCRNQPPRPHAATQPLTEENPNFVLNLKFCPFTLLIVI
ncbi:polymerase/histidinol phosphatase-like protein [Cynara cardunculus var. scolymus]|uniref:Polymerase/histidinol phosphatase-like protein n=1 Tax=Cynara cardunculus var. scolymus TaxID=59895 RepID=A0A103XD59_CYNCS|nr:polymerase/histidinol phosphatase-like protein [Cynara cardunculus var. scolymus]